MDQEKIGKFIKDIRKKNNLTQKDLADKYNVTYQAVSKWENGNNIPDISLLKQMSKDFNVSIDDILDGKVITTKHRNIMPYVIIATLLIGGIVLYFTVFKKEKSFNFKTLSTTCSHFKVTGSIAYDKAKSSIYISHIDYCGGDDKEIYDEITCNLYEKGANSNTVIDSCKKGTNINLEEYLKEIELNIDNYERTCKKYNDDSLYLEIETKKDGEINTHKIPLKLNDNCKEK